MKKIIEIDVDKIKDRLGMLCNILFILCFKVGYYAETQGWLGLRNFIGLTTVSLFRIN